MAYRAFSVRLAVIAGFAIMVVFVQMLALSRLNTQVRYPWEEEVDGRTAQPLPLEHENPHKGNRHKPQTKAPPVVQFLGGVIRPPPDNGPNRSLREIREQVMRQVHPPNRTTDEQHTTPSSLDHHQQTKEIPSLNPFLLPPDIRNCDIQSKKDALSAISRAKTEECKDLIRNVTCLAQAGRLYDVHIKNECPMGRNPGRGFQAIPYSRSAGPLPRVVFLLSVHGRAFRQARRLFKIIYHTDHYFFIHVDSRSDYLHSKLYEMASDMPNVYFPTWRMATIWGGASLLQMLLRAMEDLEFVLTDWKWDFFINLSESDFPLKTNDDLVQFLRVHRYSNFVKTHGGDINKFIQKQGLDRTFVECDNHMWRVDNRRLPSDITVDGGSDWIAINRNYSRYLVTNKDTLLVGLKRYYEFSLLPAESFFHTVVRNSALCPTFVKTNLRITNWNRRLGCRCQYKHIVDWCGCSPNDFLARDFFRLKNPGDHHFFARKFEAVVDQQVINMMDDYLYGVYPDDTPALNHYWENLFHTDDDVSKPSMAHYSTYQSFLRLSLKFLYSEQSSRGGGDCEIPRQTAVKEVSLVRELDKFSGLVVTFRDALSDKLSPPEFETFFTPVPFVKKHPTENEIGKRIWALEIGSDWDGKESIFRNYPGILGAWDEPVAALRLLSGKAGEVRILWDDPIGERVATFMMKLETNWFVSYHKPQLERPIKPGVWSVRVELPDGAPVVETTFLVVPITHEDMVPLPNPQVVNARRANTLHPGIDSREFLKWRSNVAKAGTQLEEWLDELVQKFWKMESFCRTDVDSGRCSWVSDCRATTWSTFSPDPKTEVGEIMPNGRIR